MKKEIKLKKRTAEELDKELLDLQLKYCELHFDFKKLERENRILKKYIRHIQEYLCKDIYELMDMNDRGEEDED